jgi:hypothetical protein
VSISSSEQNQNPAPFGSFRGRAASPLLRKVISNGVPASPTGASTSARLSVEIPTVNSPRQGHILRTFSNNNNNNITTTESSNNFSNHNNLQAVLPVDRPPHEPHERTHYWTNRGRTFGLAPLLVRHFYTEAEGVLIGQACVRVKHDIAPQPHNYDAVAFAVEDFASSILVQAAPCSDFSSGLSVTAYEDEYEADRASSPSKGKSLRALKSSSTKMLSSNSKGTLRGDVSLRNPAVSFTIMWLFVEFDCVVWCGVVWCGVVWCGVVWCGVV